MTHTEELLLMDLIRGSFDETHHYHVPDQRERDATLINIAVELKLDMEFTKEMIDDFHSEYGEYWGLCLPPEDETDNRPDPMTTSKAIRDDYHSNVGDSDIGYVDTNE